MTQLSDPLLVKRPSKGHSSYSLAPAKSRGERGKKGRRGRERKASQCQGGRTEQERKAGHRRLSPPPGLPNSRGGKRKRETGTGRGRGREGGSRKKAGLAIVKSIKKILACDETSRRRGSQEGKDRERQRRERGQARESSPVRISRSPIRRSPIRRSGRGRRRDPADRGAQGLGFELLLVGLAELTSAPGSRREVGGKWGGPGGPGGCCP